MPFLRSFDVNWARTTSAESLLCLARQLHSELCKHACWLLQLSCCGEQLAAAAMPCMPAHGWHGDTHA